jgi:hypothetical protein
MRAKPHGGKVSCSSTRFPTRARLRKSLLPVAGFRPLAENTDRLEALNESFALLSRIEHADSNIAERMLPVCIYVRMGHVNFSWQPGEETKMRRSTLEQRILAEIEAEILSDEAWNA